MNEWMAHTFGIAHLMTKQTDGQLRRAACGSWQAAVDLEPDDSRARCKRCENVEGRRDRFPGPTGVRK